MFVNERVIRRNQIFERREIALEKDNIIK